MNDETSLDSMIDRLVELDRHRGRALELRKKALGLLPAAWENIHADNVIEVSTVAAAMQLARRKGLPLANPQSCEQMCKYLGGLELHQFLVDRNSDDVPLLRAARVLTALVLQPGHCFSRAALVAYYRILREIYVPNPPDFSIGGVQVSEGQNATAFLTGECVSAIALLANAMERTGEFFERVHAWHQMRTNAALDVLPAVWRGHEERRARETLFVDLSRAKRYLVFDHAALDALFRQGDALTDESIRDALQAGFTGARDGFVGAIAECGVERARESKERSLSYKQRTETGHLLAEQRLKDALDRLGALLSAIDGCQWSDAAKIVRSEAQRIRKVLHPAEQYLQGVLDRELADAASAARSECDHPELAFAASAYGNLTGRWDDPRLRTAATILADALSTRGLFPVGRPIRTNYHGYRLEVVGAEVLRAMAMLLRCVRVSPTPDVPERMLRLFEDTMMPDGWAYEQMSEKKSATWTTALAVVGLHGIVRMLDELVRREVFRHFHVRYPSKDITLDNMFYSDAGLPRERLGSVAICLQAMRAHVLGVESSNEPVWSVVLHGPPGTGKTTIAEALAASANLPLVEVTPSDLVVGGADMVERRARHVFLALAMLTDAVILFDEFDSVLHRRTPKEAHNVFQFLTPGMLPKLKELHEHAKKRRVAFALATNFVAALDEAAVRKGRFDERLGIYPPDLVARSGRLLSELAKHKQEALSDPVCRDRIAQVLDLTAGGSMPTLARPGWFTAPPSGKEKAGSPFHFICGDGKAPERVAREMSCPIELPLDTERRLDIEEWREWRRIDEWDSQLAESPRWDTLRDLWSALPGLPPRPPKPSEAPRPSQRAPYSEAPTSGPPHPGDPTDATH